MHSSWRTSVVLAACVPTVFCDILGPNNPPPQDLSSSNSLVSKSWQNLTSTLNSYLGSNNALPAQFLPGAQNVSFSLGLFSTEDAAAVNQQYHYAAPDLAATFNGTRKLDGDSIYRVASISKLITVFTGMLELSQEQWNQPLTSILPDLAEFARNASNAQDPVTSIDWEDITPWTLASQISGIPQDGMPFADYLYQLGAKVGVAYGFPAVDPDMLGPCWNAALPPANCTSSEFVESVRWEPPTLQPWTTALYSDENFMLLGIVMSMLKNSSMADLYQDAVFGPLGMNSSYSTAPANNPNAVMTDATASGYLENLPVTTPSGGLFSTINDLAKFGVGILNSTLLPAATTRYWMKPHSHTASLTFSVGAPWEIVRYISPTTGKVTDIYTKLGDSGDYGGMIALIPDYNAGFSMLNTGNNVTVRSATAMGILDYVADAVLPALEAQAAVEAANNFAGSYVSHQLGLNSSISIDFNQTTGRLMLSSWISNGTDMLELPVTFSGEVPFLQMSINNKPNGDGGQIAFRASTWTGTTTYQSPGATALGSFGPFTGEYYSNFGWWTLAQNQYAGIGTDLFVFDVDQCGNATSITASSVNATLIKEYSVSKYIARGMSLA